MVCCHMIMTNCLMRTGILRILQLVLRNFVWQARTATNHPFNHVQYANLTTPPTPLTRQGKFTISLSPPSSR